MEIDIRPATLKDVNAIRQLCVHTIQNSCAKDYSPEQLEAWISNVNRHDWAETISRHYFLVAEMEKEIVGFGSIEQGEYIGYLYVSSKHLRKGISNKILDELLKESDRVGKTTIWSNVSETAKRFFIANGFSVVKANANLIDGVEIVNFKMTRKI